MRTIRILILVVLVLACILLRVSVIKIGPDEVGVRTINFGQNHGIVECDYGPGYHRDFWPLDTWNRFPRTVQRIRFAKGGLEAGNRVGGEMELTLEGGHRVNMAMEVVYRIADGQAHHVLQEFKSVERYEDAVRNEARNAASVHFGAMLSEAFYKEPSKREEARRQAAQLMSERLSAHGIQLVDLLVETIDFDPNYESLIEQKKIADQNVELQKAKAKAAEEKGKVDKIKAETLGKIKTVQTENEAEITKLKTETGLKAAALAGEARRYAAQKDADGQLYENEKKAEGQKLVKLAEAAGTERLNAALTGDGGRNLIALQAAKALTLAEVTFPSFGYEWFNPYEMATRLGGSPAGKVATTQPAAVPATAPSR